MESFFKGIIEKKVLFTEILNLLQDGVIVLKKEGNSFSYMFANNSVIRFMKDNVHLLGETIEAAIEKETSNYMKSVYLKVIQSKKPAVIEDSYNGFILSCSINPIVIDEENQYVFVIVRDITEKQNLLKRTLENEKQYRQLVNISPNPIIIHQHEKIVYCNQAGLKVLGVNRFQEVENINMNEILLEKVRFPRSKEEQKINISKLQKRNGKIITSELTSIQVEFNGKPAIHTTIRDISEREKKRQELEYLAYHDPLTGLKNRRAFIDELNQSIKLAQDNETMVSVIYLDMDEFKSINDQYGHEIGDVLLQQFAKRLKEYVRKEDTICRIGGDEFLILLNDVTNKKEVELVAERLHDACQLPYFINNKEFQVTSSFGISFYPENGHNAKLLILHADQALYKAKENKNYFSFYEER